MKLSVIRCVSGLALLAATCVPCSAQTADLFVGAFHPKSAASRGPDDVISNEASYLTFDPSAFNGAVVGVDKLFGAGSHAEISLGGAFYRHETPGTFSRSAVPVVMTLTDVPITIMARYVALDRSARVRPYVGAGLAVSIWRFQDSFAGDARYQADGSDVSGATSGLALAFGARAPLGGIQLGGELRYVGGHGSITGTSADMLGSTIDMSGWHLLGVITFGHRE